MTKRTLFDLISLSVARDVDRSGWVGTHNSTAPRNAAKPVNTRLIWILAGSGPPTKSESKSAMAAKAAARLARVEKEASHHIVAQQSANRIAQRLYTVGLRLLAMYQYPVMAPVARHVKIPRPKL